MSDNSNTKKIIELLEELVKWKRFEGSQLAKKTMKELFSKDSEKLVYQNSDGKASRDIATLSGVSDFSVRNYWKKWNIEGLVVPSDKHKGRYERMFSLEDFGIEIPLVKKSASHIEKQNVEKTGDENDE